MICPWNHRQSSRLPYSPFWVHNYKAAASGAGFSLLTSTTINNHGDSYLKDISSLNALILLVDRIKSKPEIGR